MTQNHTGFPRRLIYLKVLKITEIWFNFTKESNLKLNLTIQKMNINTKNFIKGSKLKVINTKIKPQSRQKLLRYQQIDWA